MIVKNKNEKKHRGTDQALCPMVSTHQNLSCRCFRPARKWWEI